MEHEKRYTYNHNVNGVSQPNDHAGIDKKLRNYKLMADPFLEKTSQKVYRFEGMYVSSSGATKLVDAHDPRPQYQKIQSRRMAADLIVPRFKYDHNYVGEVPPKEVTFVNLNDNISKEFLENMCAAFGLMEEVKIYYNPKNRKHLGVGKVLFENSKAARMCAEKLNQTTKMGNVMSVFIDQMGKDRANILERIILEQSRPRATSPIRKPVKKVITYVRDEPIDVEFDGGHRGCKPTPKSIYNDRRSTETKPPSDGEASNSAAPTPLGDIPQPPEAPSLPDPPLPPKVPVARFANSFDDQPPGMLNQFHDRGYDNMGNIHPAFRGHVHPDMLRPGVPLHPLPRHEFHLTPPRPFHPQPHRPFFDHNRPPLPMEPVMRPLAPPIPFHQPPRMFHPERPFEQTPVHFTPDFRTVSPHIEKAPVALPKIIPHTPTIIPQSPITPHPDRTPTDITDKPAPPTPAAIMDEPRVESLDSRIQSLLQNVGLSSPPPKDQDAKSKHRDSAESSKSNSRSPTSHARSPKSHKASKHNGPNNDSDKGVNSSKSKHKVAASERYPREPCVEDDHMSISSHSSLEDKSMTPLSEQGLKTHVASVAGNQAYQPSPAYDPYTNQPWQQHVQPLPYNNNMQHLDNQQHAPPFPDNAFGFARLAPYRDKEEDDRFINSVLEKFVNDIRNVVENDICKKMVENSAFKTFESWWFQQEDYLKPQKLLIEPAVSMKPSNQSLTSGIASLFELRHPWTQDGGLANGIGFTGGFLGIRGSMPNMPSFKRKSSIKPKYEEEGEDRKEEGEDAGSESEESDHERQKPRIKPRKVVVSESEESEEESSEEEDEEEEDEEHEKKKEARVSGDESGESSEEEEVGSESEASGSSDEEPETDQKHAVVKRKRKSEVNVSDGEVDEEDVKGSDEEDNVSVGVSGDEGDAEVKVSSDDEMDVEENVVDKDMSEEEEDEEEEIDEDMKLEGLLKNEFGKDLPAARWTNLSPIFEMNEVSSQTTDQTKPTNDTARGGDKKPEKSAIKGGRKSETNSAMLRHVDEVIASVLESARESEESSTAIPDSETSDTTRDKSDIESREWSYIVPAIVEHDYFSLPPSVKASQEDDSERTDSAHEETTEDDVVWLDHCYCIRTPVMATVVVEETKPQLVVPTMDLGVKVKKTERAAKKTKLRDITNKLGEESSDTTGCDTTKVSRELLRLLHDEKPPVTKRFDPRQFQDERQIFYDIYGRGVDEEDVRYLKRGYDEFIQSEVDGFGWLNDILWIDHPMTHVPDPVKPKRRKKSEDALPIPHVTGSVRTEGYYKMSLNEKLALNAPSSTIRVAQSPAEPIKNELQKTKTNQSLSSREARSTNRRLQASFADLDTDLLRFNQLKFRKKHLKFSKSAIHEWGLFALEPIASDEMVIEYVGQKIRMSVANEREKQYEATGLGSSYMFRVDTEMIIDATKEGNLARFINHCCNPNCYAKVITIENSKKIVIYSKRDIDVNEEITYDYKFPIEDEKIPCLCGAPGCRGTLN